MEGTSMDNDAGPSHALPATMTFPLSSSAVSGQTQQTLELSQPQKSEGQSTQAPKFSNGPHIRSRITVVCAECKRLKLKCDRRTPCSSCLKRDTTARCVYSQAAVEKIDVQSLHNRLLVLESAFNHLSSVSPTTPISAALAGLPEIKTRISVSGSSGQSSNTASQTHSLAGLPCSDRALLAIGASGSSVVISLEDVASIWLGELDDPAADTDSKVARTDTSPTRPSASGGIKVKLEPTSVLIPPVSSSSSVASSFSIGTVPPSFSPPISYDAFLPPSAFYSAPPEVTPELVLKNMPLAPRRARYLAAMRETMLLHPCFNVPHFMQRVDAMINWAESGPRSVPASGSRSFANGAGSKSKEELARELFLGPSGKSGSSRKETARPQPPAHSKPTLSFFAAACAACALGAMAAREEVVASDDSLEPGINPAALFSLSEQSLGLFEKTATYDLDSVIAMILQVLYLLHDGNERRAGCVPADWEDD
ncbi:hypothetical protein A0H81_03391 [Grifola frondosa]|uniref:Zn(2)-C6 fungal-type domain-containing protein n=1 Tax=Grifola frondosa TaxID=5627 RepID=A0A1C7MH40_GRIFR|nr:hypothetical protein A0H81_03391 [Grifola frondosa]